MNDQPTQTNEIFEAIRSGEVKMHSRLYFILRDVLGIVAIVIVLLMAVYLASFIIFVLQGSGAWFVPVFGLAGWFALFMALPWMLILLSAIFVIILAVLVKRYQFAYRWPLLYSFLGIIFLIAATCFLFVQSSFSGEFFSSPIAQEVPFLGLYYPGFGKIESGDIHRGTIVLTGANGFVLRDNIGNLLNVHIVSSTNMMPGLAFRTGDQVVVFGDTSATGTIYAFGVEKVMN